MISQILKAYCSIGKRKVIAHLAVGGSQQTLIIFYYGLKFLQVSLRQFFFKTNRYLYIAFKKKGIV